MSTHADTGRRARGPRTDCPVGHNPPEHPCDYPDCLCFGPRPETTARDHARRGMSDAVAEVHGWPRDKHRPMCLCEIHRPGQGLCDCAACESIAARRRILATIATECPGQDVAGVFVIDDALRIDFVSGAALLVGADGTLSWEGPRP